MKPAGIGWVGWSAAALCAVIVIVLIAGLFRLPPAPRETAAPSPVHAAVGLVRLHDENGSLLNEDAMLRDPTPLYLPTRWNAGENALPPDAGHKPGISFQGYLPNLTFPSSELKLKLPPPVDMPQRPADSFVTDKPSQPFMGFGETDAPVAALPERHGFVEVVATANGRLMLSQPLIDARPPEGAWQPLEFLVAIDPAGVVRPPVLTESSRIATVDDYFEEYLAKGLHIGARLPPGFYRVCIGP